MAQRVLLAYSGGLDTSCCIHWLARERGYEVLTFTCDLGQGEFLNPIREKALASGAVEAHVADLRAPFLEEFCFPALRAGAYYGDGYLLATALGRPLIAREMVRLAREKGATAVAHGCTGKGNDQVRFEAAVAALAPEITVIAPLREWDMKTREEEIAYLQKHNIPCEVTGEKKYSYDRNRWGNAIECGVLEDPWKAPPEEAYLCTVEPEGAPQEPARIEIGFEQGIPVSIDGRRPGAVELVQEIGRVAGAHGVGRIDVVEDRLVGIKSREVYEMPAAAVLYAAHRALEALTLSKDVRSFQAQLSARYGQLVYDGLWYSDLRSALDAFFAESQKVVQGSVRMKLSRGGAAAEGRRAGESLYEQALATYSEGDRFDHSAAEGFIKIWSLPQKSEARRGRARS